MYLHTLPNEATGEVDLSGIQDHYKFQWELQLVVFKQQKVRLKGIFQLVKIKITQRFTCL